VDWGGVCGLPVSRPLLLPRRGEAGDGGSLDFGQVEIPVSSQGVWGAVIEVGRTKARSPSFEVCRAAGIIRYVLYE
jgi:hypothetical protein